MRSFTQTRATEQDGRERWTKNMKRVEGDSAQKINLLRSNHVTERGGVLIVLLRSRCKRPLAETRENPNKQWGFVGRGGALVETMTFNRRVVGSTPALAATEGPWAS